MPVISTNTAANSAIINLNKNTAAQETYLEQLSSGSRINSASDDAAGLAVAGQLESDITTLEQSAKNAQQAEALLQTADGALSRQADILQRMKSLATQYNSGTVDDESREFINAEYEELLTELDLISSSTEFNGKNLIDGSFNESFIVGIQSTDSIDVDLSEVEITTTALDLSASLSESNTTLLEVTLNTASGVATESTTFADVTSGIVLGGDTDFVLSDGTNTTTIALTTATTVSELVANINAAVDADDNQLYTATLSDSGVLTVAVNETGDWDVGTDGLLDTAVTVGLTTGTGVTSELYGTGALGEDVSVSATNATVTDDLVAIDDALTDITDDLTIIDAAISVVSEARATIGAYTSAMEYQAENIDTQIESLTAAVSTIVDVDIAEAQSNFTNAQVLTEAATAALAQANQLKTSLLTLLK